MFVHMCKTSASAPPRCSPTWCCNVQLSANDSNRDQIVAEFRAALDPVRATLKEYPWLGGAAGPEYSDIYLMAFLVVRCSMPTILQTYGSQGVPDMRAFACDAIILLRTPFESGEACTSSL